MKLIAYYLPQFHEIEENNKWWGKGFTEWTNVKAAKKLYRNHRQPNVPLNHNYYNLFDKETVQWQAELAKKYGVYGFCYYHYWFEGRMILEKPAENLLKWNDIDKKFCFCWANHSWKKTWNGTNEVLINQTYGDITEWDKHINYLLEFFKDDRYIKVNNKPVFMIFSPDKIPQLDERINYYNKRCQENGFDGIYFIESLNSVKYNPASERSDAIALREPMIGLSQRPNIEKVFHILKSQYRKNYLIRPMTYDYDRVAKYSLKFASKIKLDKKVFLGCFTGWDSTPRHGRRGYIVTNGSPEKFKEYLGKLKSIADSNDQDFLFLNAWNEWAEGMYIEPDEKYLYSYLEAIKSVVEKN
jgi:hypothetical protein